MFTKINIINIVKEHFYTLRTFGTSNKYPSLANFTLFIILPAVCSFFMVKNEINLKNEISNLIASVSIFGGFLFNLLAIIYSQIEKIKTDAIAESQNKNNNAELKQTYVKEIHVNISFCIILSIFIVILLASYSSIESISLCGYSLKTFISSITNFLLILFTLTLLMVVNRVYILLKKEFK